MARIIVPAADAMLDIEIPVLDKGFVMPIDYLGGDSRIVSSARVSYGDGTKTKLDDQGLINYLYSNQHTSPFEQVSAVFHIKLPLFVFAQLVRHRTAKLNSLSARYSVMKDEFYIPTPEQIRAQGKLNKQVADGDLAEDLSNKAEFYINLQSTEGYTRYSNMLEDGVGREQARMVLPQNLYTEIYWKIDLHNLFHFLGLRLDWHAQYEIRVYAEAMYQFVQALAPMACAAFDEFHPKRGGVLLSATAAKNISKMLRAADTDWPCGWEDDFEIRAKKDGMTDREIVAVIKKMVF